MYHNVHHVTDQENKRSEFTLRVRDSRASVEAKTRSLSLDSKAHALSTKVQYTLIRKSLQIVGCHRQLLFFFKMLIKEEGNHRNPTKGKKIFGF